MKSFNFKSADKKSDDKLSKATTDACKITTEVLNGMLGQIIKDRLFNQSACQQNPAPHKTS
jgi:COP9 signalosome complex subunit 5